MFKRKLVVSADEVQDYNMVLDEQMEIIWSIGQFADAQEIDPLKVIVSPKLISDGGEIYKRNITLYTPVVSPTIVVEPIEEKELEEPQDAIIQEPATDTALEVRYI